MKCPQCGYDQKAKYGLTCSGCRYHFVFNPKESRTAGLTDGKFIGCINAASQNDTIYFTRNQLYGTYCRRMNHSAASKIVMGVATLVAAIAFAAVGVWPFAMLLFILGIVLLISSLPIFKKKTSPAQFKSLLDQWSAGGQAIERMLEQPSLHDPPPDWNEPDIYDYGVERLLIVERDILVDLFVKNGAHAEQRMLVISETGYPKYLLPVAHRVLQEQPDLPVFLLHDATPHGTEMQPRALASNLLPLKDHPVTDLGMFPDDFKKLRRTDHFDPDDTLRALPVDSMLFPFMTMGLAAAMTEGLALSEIMEQKQGSTTDGGMDFG